MNAYELVNLTTGDIIKHKSADNTLESWMKNSYVVTANYGSRVTAVRTVDITNPGEWDLIAKSALYQKEAK